MPSVLIADATIPRLGQYLIDPSAFLGWLNLMGISAVVVMLLALNWHRKTYAVKLLPGVTAETFGRGITVGAVVGIVCTFTLMGLSSFFFDFVASVSKGNVVSDRARVAGLNEQHYRETKTSTTAKQHVAKTFAQKAIRNRIVQSLVAIAALLLVIGTGYAYTVIDMPFLDHFLMITAGIGLTEELAKATAGLVIFYWLLNKPEFSQYQFKRAVLLAFGLAGLGFGAGEALLYFGQYSLEGLGAQPYALRALWCVALHGAWTLTAGFLLSGWLPADPEKLLTDKLDTFYRVTLACLPTAILHGLYNTFCFRGMLLNYFVGGISLYIASRLCEERSVEENPRLSESTG